MKSIFVHGKHSANRERPCTDVPVAHTRLDKTSRAVTEQKKKKNVFLKNSQNSFKGTSFFAPKFLPKGFDTKSVEILYSKQYVQ